MKGPNYREPRLINWKKVVDCIRAGVVCQTRRAEKEKVDPVVLNECFSFGSCSEQSYKIKED